MPYDWRLRFRDRRVEDPVLLDHGRSRIRQHRERDAAPLREVGQHRDRVVGDRGQTDTGLLERAAASLQLGELRLAVRAPVRRTRKYQHQAVGADQRLQRTPLTMLVHQVESRHARSHLGTKLPHIGQIRVLTRRIRRGTKRDGHSKSRAHQHDSCLRNSHRHRSTNIPRRLDKKPANCRYRAISTCRKGLASRRSPRRRFPRLGPQISEGPYGQWLAAAVLHADPRRRAHLTCWRYLRWRSSPLP